MIDLAAGNPGALTCIMELEQLSTSEECWEIKCFFKNHKFQGPTIYLLWNDLCDRNTEKLKVFILEASFYDNGNAKKNKFSF